MRLPKLTCLSLLLSAMLGLTACSSMKKSDTLQPQKPRQTPTAQFMAAQPNKNEFGYIKDSSLTMEQLLAQCTFYFTLDKTTLLGSNLLAVNAHGQYLAKNPSQKILLKGSADLRGNKQYNINLGYHRTQSVAAALMAQGAKKEQIEMVSYGPDFPVSQGTDEHSFQKNRFVELAYCNGASCKSIYTQKALKGTVK
jgi:outer membrane protein OmpA-like peptidoglycan-associated protein